MNESTAHLTLDVLVDYFAEQLDDEQEERVELHLADCDRCAIQANWVHSLPSPQLESWTAQGHGQATLKAFLETSLTAAEEEKPAWKERLRRWREHLTQEAQEALHLIKEVSGNLTGGLDVLLPPPEWEMATRSASRSPSFGMAGPPSFTPSTPRKTRSENPFSGMEVLSSEPPSWSRGDRGGFEPFPQPSRTPEVRIVPRGIGIEIQVLYLEPSEEPSLVVLIPMREGGQIKVEALRLTNEDPSTWIARFEKDGDFMILIEPSLP